MAKFTKMFPDQKNWVRRLANRKANSLTALRNATNYRGGMEFFSMWTCLCSDTELMNWDPGWIALHAKSLKRELHQFRRKHGFPPHPVVLLQQHGAVKVGL